MASKTTPSPVSKPGPRPTLDFFAVYSPELGPTEETELEQLLFFWPEEVSQDDKIKRIGLAQGLVNFTRFGNALARLDIGRSVGLTPKKRQSWPVFLVSSIQFRQDFLPGETVSECSLSKVTNDNHGSRAGILDVVGGLSRAWAVRQS